MNTDKFKILYMLIFLLFSFCSCSDNNDIYTIVESDGLTNLIVIDSLNQLRTIPKNDSINTVFLMGYNKPGDGGGGIFTWNDTCSLSDDSGIVISPYQDSTIGRWVRAYNEFINVNWYGVFGSKNNSDQSVTIQKVFNRDEPVFFPKGNYFVSKTIYTPLNTIIKGDGPKTTFITSSCNGWTFEPINGPWTFDIEGIQIRGIDSNSATTHTKGILSANASHNWRISNVKFSHLAQALHMEYSWIGQGRDIYIENCGGTGSSMSDNYAIELMSETNNVQFDNLQIRNLDAIDWVGRGLKVSNCLNVSFNNLSLEHILADYAGYFANDNSYQGPTPTGPIIINGGYWENSIWDRNIPSSMEVNKVYLGSQISLNGILVGTKTEVNPSLTKGVDYTDCRFNVNPDMEMGMFTNCYFADPRGGISLDATAGKLISINGESSIPATLLGMGNFKTLASRTYNGNEVESVIGLSNYASSAHNISIFDYVDVGYNYQSKGLRFEVTNSNDSWGGAIGLPFIIDGYREDQYAWAILKKTGSSQIALSFSDANLATNPSKAISTTQTGWMLLFVGPVVGDEEVIWLRMLGPQGGAPINGDSFILDSWGVSFGGLNYSSISQSF